MTTSGSGAASLVELARRRATQWQLPYYSRRRKEPIAPLLGAYAQSLLVFGADGLSLWDRDAQIQCHPGLAQLRIKALAKGRSDRLIEVAELCAGDRVLDCTLGLGQDARVMAKVVGKTGRVVGVEKSFPLYALASVGLDHVEVLHGEAAATLKAADSKSFDVVYFDPMFDTPKNSQPSFEVLRKHADHSALTSAVLDEARRVARRWVVVKAAKDSEALERLGLTPLPASRYTAFVFGRVAAAGPRDKDSSSEHRSGRPAPAWNSRVAWRSSNATVVFGHRAGLRRCRLCCGRQSCCR